MCAQWEYNLIAQADAAQNQTKNNHAPLRVFSCMLGHFYGADFEVIWVSGQAKNVCVSWPKCEEPTDERHMTLLHYRRLQLTPEV